MSNFLHSGAFGALDKEFSSYDDAAIVILPIPYDDTSSWQMGSDRGPLAVLEASGYMELYDIETQSEVFRKGIATLAPIECSRTAPEVLLELVYQRSKQVLTDRKFLVGIGGEHSISTGIVKAMSEIYPNLSVLQFDAHSDLRNSYEGSAFNHACVMARVREYCPIVQVGIRSMDSSELANMERDRVFFAHELDRIENLTERISALLTENVYITFDLDVFDPSIMPSTGTPEPGGMGWYQLLSIVESIVAGHRIVGFDVNELMPNPADKGPDFLAAKLIYRTLSMIFKEK